MRHNLINTPILKGLDELAREVETETLRIENEELKCRMNALEKALEIARASEKFYLDLCIVKTKEVEKLLILCTENNNIKRK